MKLFKKRQIKDDTLNEKVKQTDAVNIQEYHKSPERIARMIAEAEEAFKHADDSENWG